MRTTSTNCVYLLFILFSLVQLVSFGQDHLMEQHQTTTYPSGGRYEILSSTLKRANTFKLDKNSGRVYQIKVTQYDEYSPIWEELEVFAHPEIGSKPISYETPNYQLFISGMIGKDIFLIDTKTGCTWNMARDSTADVLFFYPIVSERYLDKKMAEIRTNVKKEESPPVKYLKKIVAQWDMQMYEDKAMKRVMMTIKSKDEIFVLISKESTLYVWANGLIGYIRKN